MGTRRKRQPKPRTEIEQKLRARVRALRTEGGFTLASLSEAAGISIDALARIEHGERAPSLNTVASLAHAFGVSVAELIDEQPALHPPFVAQLVRLVEAQRPPIQKAILEQARLLVAAVEETK